MDLIFHQAALGDFALILPLLRGLEKPAALAAPWSHGRLASALVPGLHNTDIEMFEFTRLYAQGGPSVVSPAVKSLFDDATRIISFVASPESAWAHNVQRLAPQASIYCVAPRPTTAWDEHLSRWHRHQFESQGAIYKSAAAPERSDQGDGWLIHPGSGGLSKCWPLEHFVEIARSLMHSGKSVRFVAGEVEIERGIPESIAERLPNIEVIRSRDIDNLLTAMNSAHGYLGNDAGPTHVASQAGLRTVALFGPSDVRVWCPVGPDVTVISPERACPMDWLSIDRVLEAVN